ncbi:hypothetical protein DFH29DRAFT_1052345, partial [Suillus ampliporus]
YYHHYKDNLFSASDRTHSKISTDETDIREVLGRIKADKLARRMERELAAHSSKGWFRVTVCCLKVSSRMALQVSCGCWVSFASSGMSFRLSVLYQMYLYPPVSLLRYLNLSIIDCMRQKLSTCAAATIFSNSFISSKEISTPPHTTKTRHFSFLKRWSQNVQEKLAVVSGSQSCRTLEFRQCIVIVWQYDYSCA